MLHSWNIKFSPFSLLSLPLFLGIIFLTSFCSNGPQNSGENTRTKKVDNETLVKINKNLVRTEDQKIDDFIKRYNWNMSQTQSGLRYTIYHQGNGPSASQGQIARINYTLSLLTGEELYSSAKDGSMEFILGKGKVENGLEEGILLLNQGDRAKFIIPSHLAYGLIGDLKKIPAKATLVYDIELLELKNKLHKK